MAATLSTRLFASAPAAVLASLVITLSAPAFAGPARSSGLSAQAAANPKVVIELQAEHFEGAGPVIPQVKLTGANLPTGNYTFSRYANPRCEGPKTELGVKKVTSGTVEGPDVNHGQLGRFGIGVAYSGDLLNEKSSACAPYSLLKKSQVRSTLAKETFDTVEEIKPAVTLAGTTGQPTGKVEFRRFAGNAACEGAPVAAGSADVNGSSVAQSVSLQTGVLGPQSYRVHYTGDEANAAALSECRQYTVGVFIRGRVFTDVNNDGIADESEPGIPNVQMLLLKAGAPAGDVKTNDKGEYEFFVTAAGSYLVKQTQPEGFQSSTVDERTVSVTGAVVTGQDFGEAALVSSTPSESPTPEPTLVDVGANSDADGEPLALTTGWIRVIVISLVVIGLLAVLVLAINARNRRDEDELERTRVDLDQTRRF